MALTFTFLPHFIIIICLVLWSVVTEPPTKPHLRSRMLLTDLPPELLLKLLPYLNTGSALSLGLTCSVLRSVLLPTFLRLLLLINLPSLLLILLLYPYTLYPTLCIASAPTTSLTSYHSVLSSQPTMGIGFLRI